MLDKLKTRSKLWAMFLGDAQGTVIAAAGFLGWTGEDPWVQVFAICAGAAVTIASTLGYIKVQGDLDKLEPKG